MSFFVGALMLALFGGIFLTLLIGLPWWAALIFVPVLISLRIILTEKHTENKIMDVSCGIVIAAYLAKLIFF